MLISHTHKFIHAKTKKTAGTSVEVYFEKYCYPPDSWTFQHQCGVYESPTGIVGARTALPDKTTWYNHMPSDTIKAWLGDSKWDEYFKFCVIRDPFDKLISGFHMFHAISLERKRMAKLRSLPLVWLGLGDPMHRVKGTTSIERFRSWIKLGGYVNDREIYCLNGEPCMDYYIRYEKLHEGIRYVCDKIGVPFDSAQLPNLKNNFRKERTPVADYYDSETIAIVQKRYAMELEMFGYGPPKA